MIKNDFKSPHSVGPRLLCATWRLATCGWPEGRLGHGLAAQSSHRGGSRAPTWSPRADRATAHRRQGSLLEYHSHAADALGKKSEGMAHRGGRVAVGWQGAAGAVAFRWREAPVRWRRPQGQSCG
jgi:hypothetical protein